MPLLVDESASGFGEGQQHTAGEAAAEREERVWPVGVGSNDSFQCHDRKLEEPGCRSNPPRRRLPRPHDWAFSRVACVMESCRVVLGVDRERDLAAFDKVKSLHRCAQTRDL